MAIVFPTALDTFDDVEPSDIVSSSRWNDLCDAVEALEEKVGVTGSPDTSSIDYRISAAEDRTDEIESDIATVREVLKSTQPILRVSRITLTGISSSQATIVMESLSNGDNVPTTTIYASYNGTYYQVSASSSYFKLSIKQAAFASTVTHLFGALVVVPNTVLTSPSNCILWAWESSMPTIYTPSFISSDSFGFTTSDFFSALNGKTIVLDLLYARA